MVLILIWLVLSFQNTKQLSLNLMSVCSHLAASDDRSKIDFSLKQIEKFISISKEVELVLNEKIDKHILNTHGVLNFLKHQMNSVRLGVGIYMALLLIQT